VLTLWITWFGLLPSFSQSSFVALLVSVMLAAIFAWRKRSIFLIAAAIGVLIGATIASPTVRHKASLSHITSGRSTLVSKGLKVAEHHPVVGVGVGGFKHAYAEIEHLKGEEQQAAASHTTPVTVVAGRRRRPAAVCLAHRRGAVDRVPALGHFEGTARLGFGLALVAILVRFPSTTRSSMTDVLRAAALIVVGARPTARSGTRRDQRREARSCAAAYRRRRVRRGGTMARLVGGLREVRYVAFPVATRRCRKASRPIRPRAG
jgi:hypothetical protein